MNRWKSIALVAISFNVGVVYATACSDAGKASAGDSSGDGSADDGDSDDGSGDDGSGDDGDDPPGDDDDGGLAELASQVTELASQVAELAASLAASEVALASLQANVDCYIGHQTDDVYWHNSQQWQDDDDGRYDWKAGCEGEATAAYEDCF